MQSKIDFVFPYVNPNDKIWQKEYLKFKKEKDFNKNERFRDFSLLKYIFRSIEKYAPYIDTVYLIVSSVSQVPSYINKDYKKLRIITHTEIIPESYLPTFNSNTIEMFIQNIPNLSEHFIYSNDDFIFTNNTTVDDFFVLNENKIKLAYDYKYKKMPITFQYCCKKTYQVVAKLFYNRKINNENYEYLKQFHGAASPRLLSDCKECYKLLETPIKKSITQFRDLERNYNQYLFGYYSLFKGNAIKLESNKIGNYVDANNGLEHMLDAINNNPSKMLCINDTSKMTLNYIRQVYWNLDVKFPEKSKFEI